MPVLGQLGLDLGAFVASAVNEHKPHKAEATEAYEFAASRLNGLGLKVIDEGQVKDAIDTFKLNVEAYRRAFNQ